jgi:uncharacterized protein
MQTGATVTHPPADGEAKPFNGSCIVARAATQDEVLEEIRKDIYYTSGVWNLDKIIIHPVRKYPLGRFIVMSHADWL